MNGIRKPARIPAQSVFFPAAVLYAMLAIALTAIAYNGFAQWLPGLLGLHHAGEMVGGFALALIAGYTLGPVFPSTAYRLLFFWALARIVAVLLPDSIPAFVTSALFGMQLAIVVVPRFWPARRWRNRMIPPLLLVLSLLPAFWHCAALLQIDIPSVGPAAVLLLTMLMAYMGGRMIAPAVAGEFFNRGQELEARLQPGLEGAVLILLPTAVALLLAGASRAAGLLTVLAGACLLVRLLRWQIWACWRRADLLGLAMGYLWLAAGLCLLGWALLTGRYDPAFVHPITVGALGTLSSGVILRWIDARNGYTRERRRQVAFTVSAFLIAVVARLLPWVVPAEKPVLLAVAAIAWCVGYGVVLTALWRHHRQTRGTSQPKREITKKSADPRKT